MKSGVLRILLMQIPDTYDICVFNEEFMTTEVSKTVTVDDEQKKVIIGAYSNRGLGK